MDSGKCRRVFCNGVKILNQYENIFYKIWQELATRYTNQEHVYFELLNEVVNKDDITSWNSIATNCIKKIREISNNVPIIVGSYWYNHVKTLSDLDIPIDENIIFSFHFYEPHLFTHQGAFWMPNMDPDFRTKFIMSYGEYDRLTKKYIGEDATIMHTWIIGFIAKNGDKEVFQKD